MERNVGGMDRNVRFGIGGLFLLLALFLPWAWGWRALFLILGAVAIATAVMRHCPINKALGVDSSKT